MSTADSPTSAKKVVIHLRATGDAPILKQAKFKVFNAVQLVEKGKRFHCKVLQKMNYRIFL